MIHTFEYCLKHVGETGRVEETREFLVKVSGLPNVAIGEGVTFANGIHGKVMKLSENLAEILVLSRDPIKPKTEVARTGQPLLVSVGDGALGRVISTLGHTLGSHKQKSRITENRVIESMPIGIHGRRKISSFLETGVSIVDSVIPLGMGQRELIIGDRKTGKTHFLQQLLLTQAKKGTVCIYCAIGKRKSEIKSVEEFLAKHSILNQSLIVAADSYSNPGEIFLAPYTAMTYAEYFRDMGHNVVLIMDDLTTHAKYYREISLLTGQFPGRESYPGDIFHVHSKLLERAGCFNLKGKEATITCLPVAESVIGDITGYIQTNLMSMTDGHLFFDSELFFQGRIPAINVFLSVTRVGKQTQSPLLRSIGSSILILMKEYEVAQRFLRFGPELSDQIKKTIERGNKLIKFFNQTGFAPIPLPLQIILISLLWQGLWKGDNVEAVITNYQKSAGTKTAVEVVYKNVKTFEELNKRVEKTKKSLLGALAIV